ncbi:hypothetical protein WA158_006243 [Blastocystis sp. Blastoise]
MSFIKGSNSWFQKELKISAKSKGCHLITNDIIKQLPQIRNVNVGMLNLFIQHTSASLSINENCDPDVRADLNTILDRLVPENESLYMHTDEGLDDMPAHGKNSLLGCSLNIPIRNGKLGFGTWQGIYLCEHRDYAGSRRILATIQGILSCDVTE